MSIRLRKDRNCFQLDLRNIVGERQNFDTKAEATQHAQKMFEVWETGKPAAEIKPWTVEKANEKYLEHCKRRSKDPERDRDDAYAISKGLGLDIPPKAPEDAALV